MAFEAFELEYKAKHGASCTIGPEALCFAFPFTAAAGGGGGCQCLVCEPEAVTGGVVAVLSVR